jgi:hypothetical protein
MTFKVLSASETRFTELADVGLLAIYTQITSFVPFGCISIAPVSTALALTGTRLLPRHR